MRTDYFASQIGREFGRYLAVAVAGLMLDVSVAWWLISGMGLSGPHAAAMGFAAGLASNYVANEVWAFRAPTANLSIGRFLGFASVALLSLWVRVLVLGPLERVLPGEGIAVPMRLTLAAGASFVVAYTLSKLLVFRRSADTPVTGLLTLGVTIAALGVVVFETSERSLFLGAGSSRIPIGPVFVIGSLVLAVVLLQTRAALAVIAPPHGPASARGSSRADLSVAAVALLAVFAALWHGVGFPATGALSSSITVPLVDTFHEGELLAGFPVIARSEELPLLIHGPGRNLLPGFLAHAVADQGHVVSFVRFVEGVGHFATMAAMAASAALIGLMLCAGRLPAPAMAMAAATGALVVLHALPLGAVSSRHALFFLIVLSTCWAVSRAWTTGGRAWLQAFLLGLVLGLAPIHVYSAAIESAVVALVGAGVLLARHRRAALGNILACAAGIAATATIVIALGGGGLYATAVSDILYWAGDGRGIWTIKTSGALRSVAGIVVVMLVLASALALAWRGRSAETSSARLRADICWVLAAATLAAARNFFDRPDGWHIAAAWLTVIVIVGVASVVAVSSLYMVRTNAARGVSAVLAMAMLVFVASGRAGPTVGQSLAALSVSDGAIVPREIQQLAATLKPHLQGQPCLLVLTNEGVINFAVDRPPCGGALYPLYLANREGDARLASWLASHPQRVVVVDRLPLGSGLDNRLMSQLLPRTYEQVTAALPYSETIGQRVVRFATPPGEPRSAGAQSLLRVSQ